MPILQCKVFTIKELQLSYVSTLLGHPQGVYINVCIKCRL